MRSAEDVISLMAVASEAETSRPMAKSTIFQHAYENAVRLRDKEVSIMYGNRIAAEKIEESVKSMHGAVTGMMESAGQHSTAANNMRASADLIHRASFRQQ